MDDKIKNLRQELDIIDDNIAVLLKKRVEIGRKIVAFKTVSGLKKDDFERENAIIQRISAGNPEISELLELLYRRIFDWVKNQ